MINDIVINWKEINFDTREIKIKNKWLIEFNDFNLMSLCWNNNWIIVKQWNFHDVNNIDIGSYVSSLIDWWGVFNKKYWNRTLSLKLFIQWENYDDLIKKIDELKEKTQNIESDLDFFIKNDEKIQLKPLYTYYLPIEDYWDILWNYINNTFTTITPEYRTYKATVSSIIIPSFSKNTDFVDDIEINFLITSWFWENKNSISLAYLNKVSNFQSLILNEWKYESFAKIIIISKNSWNNISGIDIALRQIWDETWFTISISEVIWDDSIIIFDYREKTISINWENIPFYWVMTSLSLWYNIFDFIFTGSVNIDAYILYNKTYL